MNIQEKFNIYEQMLRDWSARMNLVAPSTLDDIKNRHIADSAQLADILPNDAKIVDLGSGAGFPALVLAIMGRDVTAIESIGKKCDFLRAVKQELNLENFTIYQGRVEDFIKKSKGDDSQIFTARAFASLDKILNYVKPIKNSRLFLLKGREIESEILSAKKHHKFDYKLTPSKTGDGFIINVFHVK